MGPMAQTDNPTHSPDRDIYLPGEDFLPLHVLPGCDNGTFRPKARCGGGIAPVAAVGTVAPMTQTNSNPYTLNVRSGFVAVIDPATVLNTKDEDVPGTPYGDICRITSQFDGVGAAVGGVVAATWGGPRTLPVFTDGEALYVDVARASEEHDCEDCGCDDLDPDLPGLHWWRYVEPIPGGVAVQSGHLLITDPSLYDPTTVREMGVVTETPEMENLVEVWVERDDNGEVELLFIQPFC